MRELDSDPRAAAAGPLALPASLVVVTIVITATLVWMVRVKSQAIEVGYRIQSLRTQVVQLEQQRSALEVEKNALSRPTRLAAIARNELGLVPPDASTSLTVTP